VFKGLSLVLNDIFSLSFQPHVKQQSVNLDTALYTLEDSADLL